MRRRRSPSWRQDACETSRVGVAWVVGACHKNFSGPSPGERLAVPEVAARRRVGVERRGPDDAAGALLDRARGLGPTHVGADPARTDGVDLGVDWLQLKG